MWTCRICRTLTDRDDAMMPTESGWCICLRCYLRETQTAKPLAARVRRDARDAAEGAQ